MTLLGISVGLVPHGSCAQAQIELPDTTCSQPVNTLESDMDSLGVQLDTLFSDSTTTVSGNTLIPPEMEIQTDAEPILSYNPMEGMIRIQCEEPPQLRRRPATSSLNPPPKLTCSPFFIEKTEVTNRQFACFLSSSDSNATHFDRRMNIIEINPGVFRAKQGKEVEPIAFVDWYGAFAFATWAGKSLPTEEEWVLAGLGSVSLPDTGRIFPWGIDPIDSCRANGLRATGFPAPAPTGSFPAGATASGILDMAGNVAEWTTTEENLTLPEGISHRFFVVKGGSFLDPAENLTLTARVARDPHERLGSVGFRCILRDQLKP